MAISAGAKQVEWNALLVRWCLREQLVFVRCSPGVVLAQWKPLECTVAFLSIHDGEMAVFSIQSVARPVIYLVSQYET